MPARDDAWSTRNTSDAGVCSGRVTRKEGVHEVRQEARPPVLASARNRRSRRRGARGGARGLRSRKDRGCHADQDRHPLRLPGRIRAQYEADIGGAIAGLSQFAGAKPKNPNKPSDGMVGGSVAGHPLEIVGFGCSNDSADLAIKETKRLMEQLGADILIGPLSGDESIAVANYAKAHPTKTFINGTAGAQDTTLQGAGAELLPLQRRRCPVERGHRRPACTRRAGRTAAIIMDDYSFGWTSAAGIIADFCAAGGKITKRVFPPLNTTDYSSYRAAAARRRTRWTATSGSSAARARSHR